MMVVLEDGQPGDGADDGDPKEEGPEGSIKAFHLLPLTLPQKSSPQMRQRRIIS